MLWLRFEEGHPVPIENPQLWPLLFPTLRQGYEAGEVQFLIWMYRAFDFPDVYDYLQRQPEDVLRRALDLDPANDEVVWLLVVELLNRLDYGLHELPSTFVLPPEVLLAYVAEVHSLQERFPHVAHAVSRHGESLADYEEALRHGLQQNEQGRASN